MSETYDPRRTRPLSQVELEKRLQVDLDALEDTTHEYRDDLESLAQADSQYKRLYARSFLDSRDKTVKQREFRADDETAQEYEEYRIADAKAKATKSALEMLHRRIEALRSLNGNLRSQVSG